MKSEPVVIEKTINASVEKVWRALTDNGQMKHWYFDISSFKPEVGSKFQFEGSNEDRSYLHLCEVRQVIVNKKLSYSWQYQGYDGDSLVTFELFPAGSKTRIKLTHEGLDTFPLSNRDFAKENFVTGWTEIIGSTLPGFVEHDSRNGE